MEKVYLQKILQHGTECYIGKIDPRKLIRVATKIEMSSVQDAQRPLNAKRVKEIASYVSENEGILPNTLTLATNDDCFNITPFDSKKGLFYIDFPESEDEFSKYENKIDVMDGQHRLYSFLPEQRQIQEDDVYEIGFTLFLHPTLEKRRKIFISCNEKQEKVSGNLLMWFKNQLGMLNDNEKIFYPIVSSLSQTFPLKDHIIMSAEKIKNGVKAKEVMAALKQARIQDMTIGGKQMSNENKVEVITKCLSAWQKVVGFSFSSQNGKSTKEQGAAIKMAGLKYMILLIPAIWERASSLHHKFDNDFVEETIKKFITTTGVERDQFFTCEEHKYYFRDRSGVDNFATESIKKIKALGTEDFNPLA